jgi:transposase
VKNITTYVGVDAHKKDLVIAMLIGDAPTPVTWTVPNEPAAVRRLVRRLERNAPGPVRACYEAGPCGYALQRQMATPRLSCQVIAPTLMPRKPGERIKTNPRDARKLAELLRAGLLTEVRPPTPADEAVRDLCRARDDAREDLQRCRHRMGKLLLRRGLHYSGRNWTRAHRRWIDSLEWAQPAERVVVDDDLLAIDHTEARLIELDARVADVAQTEPYRERVGWLRCFRGIDTLTAMLILAELHDFRRFDSPRALMAYLSAWYRARIPAATSIGAGSHHPDGQCAGSPRPRRNRVALSTSTPRWGGLGPSTQRSAGSRDRDCGQGAATTLSAVSTADGTTQAVAQNRRRDRARIVRLPLGGAAAGPTIGELTSCRTGVRLSSDVGDDTKH